MSTYSRLVRFIAKDGSQEPLVGEPVSEEIDVGFAAYNSEPISVNVFSGKSILSPGHPTGKIESVGRLLSPLAEDEVGTIRCIGLNYVSHAQEVGLEIPTVPTLFMKPSTALSDPWPAKTKIPKAFAKDNAADYESEVAIVIGKDCKDVSEQQAMDYLLGFTAANDISSRLAQFAQSQWCFSKSFDGACPVGPAFVPKESVKDMKQISIQGSLNGDTVQKSDLGDLIFSVPKLISFLSQGTTLKAGTLIITGTPAGVGWSQKPKKLLQDGDIFRVYVSHGVGSLISHIEVEC